MKTTLFLFLLAGTFSAASARDVAVDSVVSDEKSVTVSVDNDGRTETRRFEFPAAISEYKVIPYMQGAAVLIAAKPQEPGDWFWGIAYLGGDAQQTGTVARWTNSPPHDARLLAVEHPEGDSFVVYAASFKRDHPNSNAIRTYAYVNHCPGSLDGRDIAGCLYAGEIGGPLVIGTAEQADGGNPADPATPD